MIKQASKFCYNEAPKDQAHPKRAQGPQPLSHHCTPPTKKKKDDVTGGPGNSNQSHPTAAGGPEALVPPQATFHLTSFSQHSHLQAHKLVEHVNAQGLERTVRGHYGAHELSKLLRAPWNANLAMQAWKAGCKAAKLKTCKS